MYLSSIRKAVHSTSTSNYFSTPSTNWNNTMTKSAKTEPKDQLDSQNAMPEDEFVRDMAKLHESDGIVADGDTVQRALSQLAGQDSTTPLATSMVPGYEDLRLILELAYEQAA